MPMSCVWVCARKTPSTKLVAYWLLIYCVFESDGVIRPKAWIYRHDKGDTSLLPPKLEEIFWLLTKLFNTKYILQHVSVISYMLLFGNIMVASEEPAAQSIDNSTKWPLHIQGKELIQLSKYYLPWAVKEFLSVFLLATGPRGSLTYRTPRVDNSISNLVQIDLWWR